MSEPTGNYDGRGSRSPRWWPSRYGPDDQLGTQNELTPQRTLEALKLPRTGAIVQLAQTLTRDAPHVPPRIAHSVTLAHWAMDGTRVSPEGSELSGFEDQLTLNTHTGCHIDGFGHMGIGGHAYNGVHYRDFYTPNGLSRYGMENVLPWVTRGVCLDVAALESEPMLPGGYAIGPSQLEAACRRQGVEVRPGDVVLLHTGWGRLWTDDPPRYNADEPGLGWDGAHWLTDRRVTAIGADNWALEVLPSEDPEAPFVVHQHLLSETGTYIIENLTLGELAGTGRSEFLFTMAPAKIAGLTGSPVSPLAVV
jgi:kynurenine formamidase